MMHDDDPEIPPFRLAILLKLARLREKALKDLLAQMQSRRADALIFIGRLQAEREAGLGNASIRDAGVEERVEWQRYLRGLSARIREEMAALESLDNRMREIQGHLTQACQDRYLLEKLAMRDAKGHSQRLEIRRQEELDEIAARLHAQAAPGYA
jgi:flagellar export protein FliJ